jgi:hypothetical protein
VNPEQLRDLGFQLEGRAPGGESGGAWFAIAADGARVVLKWFADEGVADRCAVLLPALDVLRSVACLCPSTRSCAVDGWTLSRQVLPGRSFPIAPPAGRSDDRVRRRRRHRRRSATGDSAAGWGEFVIHTLTVGEDGWAQHESLRAHSDRARRIIDFVESVGADAEPSWFPTSGLVHLDLHTDNVLALNDGTLTGIVDWEGACAGDHRYDLVAYAFDLDGHGQQIWDRVEPLVEPHMLRAYVAHMALRRTDWAIRYHPEDVPRWTEPSACSTATAPSSPWRPNCPAVDEGLPTKRSLAIH